MSLITTVKPARCLAIFLLFIILFQIPVFHSSNLKSQKYYNSGLVIVNIDMEQTALFANSEMLKRNSKLYINRMYLLHYLKFISVFNLNLFLPLREVIVDIKKTILSFTLVYFSGSKYKGTCTYC